MFVAPSFDELDAVAVDSKGEPRRLTGKQLESIRERGSVLYVKICTLSLFSLSILFIKVIFSCRLRVQVALLHLADKLENLNASVNFFFHFTVISTGFSDFVVKILMIVCELSRSKVGSRIRLLKKSLNQQNLLILF